MKLLRFFIVGLCIFTMIESMDKDPRQKESLEKSLPQEKPTQEEYFKRVIPLCNVMALLNDEKFAIQDSQLGQSIKKDFCAQIDEQLERLNSQIGTLNDFMLNRRK